MKIFKLGFLAKLLLLFLLALPLFFAFSQKAHAAANLSCEYATWYSGNTYKTSDGTLVTKDSYNSAGIFCKIDGRWYNFDVILNAAYACAWTNCGSNPGACYTGSGAACISSACGASSCGCTSVSGVRAWAKYNPTCTAVYHSNPFSGYVTCNKSWTYATAACSTVDKCLSTNESGDGYSGSPSETALRAGKCSCSYGGQYKTCCSGTTPKSCAFYYGSSRDSTAPPEGTCNGNSVVRCGGSGEPACGQAACNTLCSPVNGGWSGWSGWSNPAGYSDGGGGTCSKTCGTGTQSRTRACNNPAPNSCGAACSGSGTETQSCNTQSCTYNATVNAYVDYNGNAQQDINGQGIPIWTGPTEPLYTGNLTISYNGGTSVGSPKIFSGGTTTIAGITNNQTENITLIAASLPSGWKLTTTNPASAFGPPNATVNFGIQPPPPVCTPSTMTVNTPIFQGGTSNLSVSCTVGGGSGSLLNYEWNITADPANSPAAPGNFGSILNPHNFATNTYTAPVIGTTYYPFIVDASVSVCNPGTSTGTVAPNPVCTAVGNKITVNPKYSIKGFVFVDLNKNAAFNAGESNYNGAPALKVSICPGQYCAAPLNAVNGNFDSGIIETAGTYLITLVTMPTNPDGSTDKTWFNTTVKQYSVTVGHPCSTPSGICDANGNGNVSGVAFGISNMNKWFQTIGGDVYEAGGVINPEPQTVPAECADPTDATRHGYMSISKPTTIQMPGIIFTGNGSTDFGGGDASLKNWIVKDTISLSSSTSYAAVRKSIMDKHVTINSSPCADVNNCALPTTPGVYTIGQASDTVKLVNFGTNNTFPNTGDYTFLIPGDLEIATEIHVPIGATATFVTAGSITVDGNIGTGKGNFNSPNINVDGYFSAGANFTVGTVEGADGCLSSNAPDQRLNMSGSIVTNTSGSGGIFSSKRDMCEGDVCPTFSITARPDFVLNAPSYLLSPTIIWQEIAP